MKKIRKILRVFFSLLLMFVFCCGYGNDVKAAEQTDQEKIVNNKAEAIAMPLDTVLGNTRNYILKTDTAPDQGSQWNVIGLSRSGLAMPDSYKNTFYSNIAALLKEKNGILTKYKYSDYSKLILSMTAIGKDARNIEGYNLLEKLADFDKVKYQGFNGPIWAFIALKSNPAYEIPSVAGVSNQTTETGLIEYLLKGEVSGGGWTLFGSKADVDITAMTIQALAPYYKKSGYENVTAAIDRGLNWLSHIQMADGGFYTLSDSGIVANSESTSQVVTALSAIGIDCMTDSRFVKAGKWPVNALLYYYKDGGFMHIKDGGANNGGAEAGKIDNMATEQAFYALTAYKRMLEGKTALYDMSDIAIAPANPDENQSEEPTTKPTDTKPADPNTQQEEPVKVSEKLKLKVSKATTTSITLKWNKITGTKGYRIFRYNTVKKKYELIASVSSGKTSYTFKRLKGTKGKKLTSGTAYKLRVSAYEKVKGAIVYQKTETIKTATRPSKTVVKLTGKSSKVKISWKKVKGSSGYEIYMSAKKKSGYQKIKTMTSGKKVSYTKTKLKKKKTYYVKVRAYKKVGSQKVYGAFSGIKSVKIK